MKQLFSFLALISIIAVGGFLYRNVLEQPSTENTDEALTICQLDRKVCLDGTSVGRTGPSCEFSMCALPNVELPNIKASFVLPSGYVENKNALGSDITLLAAFEKSSKDPQTKHALVVRRYEIPKGKDANEVMLSETMYESSGEVPKSMQEFTPVIVQGRTFQSLVVERFEGQVHSIYYLPREKDVLRFEVLERDIDWTNPDLIVGNLPEHKALLSILTTLQTL
jgi:hypothetical protein